MTRQSGCVRYSTDTVTLTGKSERVVFVFPPEIGCDDRRECARSQSEIGHHPDFAVFQVAQRGRHCPELILDLRQRLPIQHP